MIFLGLTLTQVYAINLVLQGYGHMYLITNSLDWFLGGVLVVLIIFYRKKLMPWKKKSLL